ncbi:SAM-dependent methyltransferase [Amycolatopsis roodepoortensis]|uniref:SAM-dependent methyltransferase n=1 Tax=Amycolatopsis roodepoortensis TaxID=700274 RepID=UPI00214C5C45|nr:SAM-dependent methyltransferase [Amycolatopsis roodepoortensis]UUV32240.1 SAM-dependent methyltransferase [Amycolatopsis roodepoortensis]
MTRAGVRAALGGRWDDLGALSAAWRIRVCMPAFPETITAEHEFRDRVLIRAARRFRQYVVVDPDLPPWKPVHEVLPADRGARVLYLIDDAESAVRSWMVAAYRETPDVSWMSSAPRLGACLRTAAANGEITLDAPIWVVLSSALQHTWDPQALLADLWDVLPADSRVSVTHVAPQHPATTPDSGRSPVEAAFTSCLPSPLVLRPASDVLDMFTDPHAWDLIRCSGVEIHAPPCIAASRSTTDTAAELITVIARRPPRTRPRPSASTVDHARNPGHDPDA